ncbi:MAG: hypothetical protein H8D43_03095 [Chloroflexi bacterium]|nr:hypothetical protein [Chloroflexota bacterium]
MIDIFYDLIFLFISTLQKKPKIRLWVIGISGVVTIVATALILTVEHLFVPEVSSLLRGEILPAVLITFGFWLALSLASFAPVRFKNTRFFDLDIESIRQERKEIEQRISSEGPRQDIVATIQLSLNQLTEYYAINKVQARRSFGWSVSAIIAGLATIIGGIWIFYFRETPSLELTAITGIAGVLAEFIGGACFFLYNKSLNQLNFFYVELVRLQDTMLSIKLIGDITDAARRNKMREELVVALINRGSTELQVGTTDEIKSEEGTS